MAKPSTIRGGKVRIYMGDNSDPTIYKAPCGFNSRSLSFSRSLEEQTIPDCDDPDAATWISRGVSSLSMSISGEGVLAQESLKIWLDAYESGESIRCKIEVECKDEKQVWKGNVQIESLELGAENGKTVTLNVSMQSDGEMVRTIEPIPAPTPKNSDAA